MKDFSEKETQRYYDSFGDMYEMVWNEQIHTGYFDKEKSLEQAVQDMDVFLAGEVGIQKNSSIVVVGSGRGGADRFFVQQFGAKVVGVDLSEKQIAEARKKAEAENLPIEYIQASMAEIPLEKDVADYIWIQEAFFHCHDKPKAASEFARILKSGGKVLMEDTLLMDEKAREEVMESFGQRVKVNEILMPEEYAKIFEEKGLTLEKKIDLSEHLIKTYKAIIKHIHANKEMIRAKTPSEYQSRVDVDFGFLVTLQLVEEGKLGCVAFIFKK